MTVEELKYYGSPLNKFLSDNCRTPLVINNIDMVVHDYEKNRLRIIESKHSKEDATWSQMKVLNKLYIAFKTLAVYYAADDDPIKLEMPEIELCIIRGNPPYDKAVIIVEVLKNSGISYDRQGGIEVNQEELISFLNFEKELIDIVNERN